MKGFRGRPFVWWTPFVIAVLPFVVFWQHTLGLRTFYYHDIQYYFYPYHKIAADTLRSGTLPLWNPYAFSGIPLLGDGQTALLYPPNWLFLLLPAVLALNCVILLQFSLAGVGAWLYGRVVGLRPLAALLAALAFMGSGFLTTRVVHLSIMAGGALVPLVFWSVERLLQRQNVRRFAVAAGCVALQAVAGHPQVPVYTAFAAGVYVLVQAVVAAAQSRSPRSLAWLPLLGGVYVAGYALAALQIVPWFEFASFSPRAAGASFPFVTYHSVRGADWWLWLFPYSLGSATPNWFWANGPDLGRAIQVWERSAYVGVTTLVLGASGLALWAARRLPTALPRRPLWALVAVLVVGLLVAAGDSTPFGRLVYLLPVMGKLRAYARAVVLASFALSILAGVGLHALLALPAPSWRRGRTVMWATWASVAALMGTGVAWAQAPALPLNAPRTWWPLVLLLATGLGLAVLRRPKAAWFLVALVALDLGIYAAAFNPTTTPAALTGTPPSVQWLEAQAPPFRTASFIRTDTLAPPVAQAQLALSWGMAYGLSSINGFNSLQPRRYTDLLFSPETEDVSYGFLGDQRLVQAEYPLLNLLDVNYVLLQPESTVVPGATWEAAYRDDTVTIYRNLRPWGRAFFVNEVQTVTPTLALQRLRDNSVNPRRVALVEADQATLGRLQGVPTPADVTVTEPTPNEMRITIRNHPYRRLLVISLPWFPGWEARLDGAVVPLLRTDYVLSGVIVPPGDHTVELRYRPRSVMWGAAISGVAVLGLALALGRKRQRGRMA